MAGTLKEHPRYKELHAMLKGVGGDLTCDWKGRVFRCVDVKWARPSYLVSGEGTMKHGGRWMRRNLTRAVYAASSESIALKESRRPLKKFGIDRPRTAPRVVVELEARLGKLADLRKLDRLVDWPDLNELLTEDWEKVNSAGAETLSQAVGRALFALGFEGMIIPSSRDRRGRNFIWFPENLQADSKIVISGENDLDRWIAL